MPLFNNKKKKKKEKEKKKEKKGLSLKIELWLNRFGFFKKDSFFDRNAIQFLNIAQFLGVVNDNFFKYLIVFLFIHLRGIAESPIILTWVGIVYVLPFLLFSSAAGVWADRFSKQRMIIFLKFTEVIIMLLGIVAFLFQSDWASYTLLFLLSLQSALFGPPKYSIIPELVKQEQIPKANGLITSFTYLGIIVGTFLASFLTQITDKNFPLTAGVCVLIAIGGFISSLFIPKTEPKHSEKRANPLFLYEIYGSLRHASKVPYLLAAIFGSASFLFIGAYFQLNIIPFAVQSLKLSEVAGGYLFLITAVGIALGAVLGGRLSKHRPEVGLACMGGMSLAVILFFMGLFPTHWTYIFIALFVLGVFGGLYIVPFDSFIQRFSPDMKRGQIVAAANFLSFCGVLVAPLLLYLFSETLELTAAQGFIITSVMIFLLVLVITSRVSGFFFNYLSRTFVKPFYNVKMENMPEGNERPFVMIFKEIKGLYICLLSASNPHLHFYIPRQKKRYRDSFFRFFSSVDYLYVEDKKEAVFRKFVRKMEKDHAKEQVPCLLFPYPSLSEEKSSRKWIREIQKKNQFDLMYVEIKRIRRKDQIERKHFKRGKVTFRFSTH